MMPELMTIDECIESLNVLLGCVDDKLQGERDKMTKLVDLKPSSFEFILFETIRKLEWLRQVCALDRSEGVLIMQQKQIDAQPVRHGRWIECDYKHIEHGMIETEPNAGLYCSECRAAFQKKKMTYKQYCAACGAQMDGGADNG